MVGERRREKSTILFAVCWIENNNMELSKKKLFSSNKRNEYMFQLNGEIAGKSVGGGGD